MHILYLYKNVHKNITSSNKLSENTMKIQSEIQVKKYESVFIDEKLAQREKRNMKDGKFIENIK